jgi:hypothetical protein
MFSYLRGIVTGLVAGMYVMTAFPQWPTEVEEVAANKVQTLFHFDALKAVRAALHD